MNTDLSLLLNNDYNYHHIAGHDLANLLDNTRLFWIKSTGVLNDPSEQDILEHLANVADGFYENERYVIRCTADPDFKNDIDYLNKLASVREITRDDLNSNYIYDKLEQKVIKYV